MILLPSNANVLKELKKSVKDPGLFIGIELEAKAISCFDLPEVEEAAQDLVDTGMCIAVHDGSVDLEIVTLPMNPWRMKGWLSKNKESIKALCSFQDPDASAHMHISKKAFLDEPSLRTAVILGYMAVQSDHVYLEWLIGREPNDYCKVPTDIDYGNCLEQGAKYVAVNTSNTHTVEYRMFSCTNNIGKLQRRVDFLHALVDYSNGGGLPILEDFLKFFFSWCRKDTPRSKQVGQLV